MEQKDYYSILGVSEEAGQEEIKKTYRRLAFQYHPDRTGNDPASTRKMKELNEAYATLSNPEKRREYDLLKTRFGYNAYSQFRQKHSEEDIYRGSDINQIFEEFARVFAGFRKPEDIFSQSNFYGTQYRTFEFRRPGFSSRVVFYNFNTGGSSSPRNQQGAGGYPAGNIPGYRVPLPLRVLSRILRGVGEKMMDELEIPTRGKDVHDTLFIPPKDVGSKIEYPARRKWKRAKDLMITIPPGIKNGQKIKLTGQGEAGKHGGEPGDLYIEVKISGSVMQRIGQFLKNWL